MGFVIINQAPDRDEYILWSDFTERPIAAGTRAEMIPYVDKVDPPDRFSTTAERFDRADRQGSSMIPYPHGWWESYGLIYEQRGYIPRKRLYYAALLHLDGRFSDVWDLLEPLEDGMEVRRG